ncbi:MAG: archaeal proteasome endopeptidase complex subunit beta [Promethearchaeota archaeon]
MENASVDVKAVEEVLRTGTTTIGMVYGDGVLMATDSQATAGFMVATKIAQKLYQVNDFAAATIAGGVADCQYVVSQARALSRLRELNTGAVPDVVYVANVIKNILFSGRSLLYAFTLVGGWSPASGGPKLYGIDFIGTLFEEERYISFGSGSTFALGVLETSWKPDAPKEEAVALAEKALTAARNRDAGSGFEVQMATITAEGFQWLRKPVALDL